MADLIAIGYPDEVTATAAADEARRLAKDLIIQPDAIAVISRDEEGNYHVTTNHHMVWRSRPGQGGGGDEQVRRHRAEDLPVQAG
jgi:uncharacterized membrane protein